MHANLKTPNRNMDLFMWESLADAGGKEVPTQARIQEEEIQRFTVRCCRSYRCNHEFKCSQQLDITAALECVVYLAVPGHPWAPCTTAC